MPIKIGEELGLRCFPIIPYTGIIMRMPGNTLEMTLDILDGSTKSISIPLNPVTMIPHLPVPLLAVGGKVTPLTYPEFESCVEMLLQNLKRPQGILEPSDVT